MNRTISIFLTCIFLCLPALAQDTTRREFFPLHLGDLWQYQDQYNQLSTGFVADDDSLMPNGYHYARVQTRSGFNLSYFVRVDSNLRVQDYGEFTGDTCGGAQNEFNLYRLNEPLMSFWELCENIIASLNPPPWFFRYDGISIMNIFGAPREVMMFSPGEIDRQIGNTVFYALNFWLVRGIGRFRSEDLEGGFTQLTGAIINGVQYGTVVAVDDIPSTQPKSFVLNQNYPNPFNPTTTIEYHLPQPSYISLKIYNVMGQEVALLVEKHQEQGKYRIIFDGSRQPSGVYFYRLLADGFSSVRPMILIK